MHGLRTNLFVKTAAVFLAVLLFLLTLLSAGCVIAVSMFGGYVGEYQHNCDTIIDDALYSYGRSVAYAYMYDRKNLENHYGSMNFCYQIADENGNVLVSNLDGVSTRRPGVTYRCTVKTVSVLQSEPRGSFERTATNAVTETTVIEYVLPTPNESQSEYTTCIVTLWEKEVYSTDDALSALRFWLDFAHKYRNIAIGTAICGFILLIADLVFLFAAAGHRLGQDKLTLNKVDRIPFDLYLCINLTLIGLVTSLAYWFIANSSYYKGYLYYGSSGIADTVTSAYIAAAIVLIAVTFDYLLLLGGMMTFATRIKTGTLIKNTLIYKIIALICRGIAACAKGIWRLLCSVPLVWKTSLGFSLISILELIMIAGTGFHSNAALLFFAIEKAVLFPIVIWIAVSLRKLKTGGEAIAAGNVKSKVSSQNMPSECRSFAETLNNIGAGLNRAVAEQTKSERMKTELITNVSHDIKTPLTSIINYVDLLQKEPIENQTAQDYLGILSRQCARLKKLIEDLVEASKASTGNLSVSLERCELGVLLEQALGEYAERLSDRDLTPVITQPETPICILADGRRMWRIFDNLLGNICKYAQSGTRVYFTLEQIGKRAVITFRNVSREPLNISSRELMERFVRGDESRNTEGSGLGLSIAQSLAELQKGHLELAIDGDLFKAILSFDTID